MTNCYYVAVYTTGIFRINLIVDRNKIVRTIVVIGYRRLASPSKSL